MTFEEATAQMPVEAYRPHLERSRLTSITLDRIKSELNRELLSQAKLIEPKVSRECRIFGVGTTTPEFCLDYRLVAFINRRSVFRLNATYRVQIATEEPASEEFLTIYGRATGDMQVWPYVRHLVDSVTGSMGIPRITLPLLINSGVLDRPSRGGRSNSASQSADHLR